MKAFIVYPTYTNIDNQTYIQLYGRLENGESFVTVNKFNPYFFIKESDSRKAKIVLKGEDLQFQSTSLKDFKENKVVKLVFPNQPTLNKLKKELHDAEINTYEGDVKPHFRFMMDKGLLGTIDIDGDYTSQDRVERVYNNPELTNSDYLPKLRVASVDLEGSQSKDKILCVGIYSKDYEKCFMIGKKKTNTIVPCKDEEEMLEKFRQALIELDPDIITGWNVIDFDFVYLKQKFDKYKIPFNFGRDLSKSRLRIESGFFKKSSLDITGRLVLDGMNFIKDPFIKEAPSIKTKQFTSYSLENVSQLILKKGKTIKGDINLRQKEIEKFFKTNQAKLAEYNLMDCQLVYDILEKTDIINLSIERSQLTGMPLDKITASIASFDSLYIREARKRGLVSPTTRFTDKLERIKGGFVMSPKPGIYKNVLVFDFKSLYPSIIRTFNIDPASFQEKKKKDSICSPNNACFKNQEGILPMIIEKLHQAREKAKKENRELSSYAIKIIMNCFSPDTEILTENGIKSIKDTKIGEKVYSINPSTNKIEIQPITKKFIYDYKGEMINIRSNVVDYSVTPNHRFLVDFGQGYEWKEAEELANNNKNFWLPKHNKVHGAKKRCVNLKDLCKKYKINYRKKGDNLQKKAKHSSIKLKYNTKDWLEFLGWFISEGHIYTSKPKKYPGKISWRGITKVVMINQKIKKKREKIERLLTKMGLKYCKQFNGLSINNHILAEILEKECGTKSNLKKIPNWIYSLDYSLLKHLFDSLMEGDGDSKGQRYSTNSKQLSLDFTRLLHHLGIYGFVYKDIQKYKGEDYKMYRVQINKKRGIKPHISPKRNIIKKRYNGKVYCVEVKPHHTVLAGRNTRLNFCGQSFFGVLASPNCRYFNLDIANAITNFGQDIIKLTSRKIQEKHKSVEVIYGDTDSIFVNTNLTKEKANKLGKEIQDEINDFYQDYVKKKYKRKSFLELEFEKQYLSLMMPAIRGTESGAKKRYAGLIEKDGKEHIQIVGLEAIRGDWTKAAQDFQRKLLDKVFHNINPTKFIRQYVNDLREGKLDDKLIYKKSIRKNLVEYTKTTPPHVKAARKLKPEELTSSVIQYYITTDGPEPIQKLKHQIDYEHYIKKQIEPIAKTILSLLDIQFEDIIKGSKQSTLF